MLLIHSVQFGSDQTQSRQKKNPPWPSAALEIPVHAENYLRRYENSEKGYELSLTESMEVAEWKSMTRANIFDRQA